MANESLFTFRRPDLALHYCDSLEGKGLLDGRSGLFLAAPRRTGKSTFLREDCVFRANLDTDSAANWTVIPAQTGHVFHGKLDS